MNSKASIIKALTFSTVAVAISGCGTIASNTQTDADLERKAAFAINTSAERVQLLSKSPTLDSVEFQVKSDKGTYNCYFTSILGVSNSQAICSGPIDGEQANAGASSKPTANCNALLKAANRC